MIKPQNGRERTGRHRAAGRRKLPVKRCVWNEEHTQRKGKGGANGGQVKWATGRAGGVRAPDGGDEGRTGAGVDAWVGGEERRRGRNR